MANDIQNTANVVWDRLSRFRLLNPAYSRHVDHHAQGTASTRMLRESVCLRRLTYFAVDLSLSCWEYATILLGLVVLSSWLLMLAEEQIQIAKSAGGVNNSNNRELCHCDISGTYPSHDDDTGHPGTT